mgnify:CR=1 FL=1
MSAQTPLEAVQTIRSGVLFQIVATLLLIIGVGSSLGFAFGFGSAAGLGFAAAVALAAAVVGILGVLRVRRGFIALRDSGLNVGIGATGATLILVGYVLIVLGAVLSLALVGAAVLALGEVIEFIGVILLAIGFYNLGSAYNEGLVKWGGILSIILGFIGYILVYIGLGSVMRNMSSGSPQPYYTPQQPYAQAQVYQVGQGVLRPDGYASFTLYSPYQAKIVGGYIEGYGISATNFTPDVLSPGTNNVTAYFGNVGALQHGVTYVIVLTVEVQGSTTYVRVNVAYQ